MTQESLQTEWQLLKDQPDVLLSKYQSVIAAIVASFLRRGFFEQEEKAEIIQKINLALLEGKLKRMAELFDGSVQLRTYFSKVVHNICHDLLRKSKRQPRFLPEEQLFQQEDHGISGLDRLLLRDECLRLEALLALLPRYYRSLLCLKAWARIVFSPADLQFYIVPAAKSILKQFKQFFKSYDELRDPQVYAPLAALFSVTEKKEIAPDSLRRWTNMRVDRLVEDLNGQASKAPYNPKLLKTLMQYYYETSMSISEK